MSDSLFWNPSMFMSFVNTCELHRLNQDRPFIKFTNLVFVTWAFVIHLCLFSHTETESKWWRGGIIVVIQMLPILNVSFFFFTDQKELHLKMVNINMQFLKCIISCHSRHVYNAMYVVFMLFVVVLGTFKLTVEFTEEYPNKPPTVRFISKMFHPNGKIFFFFIQNHKYSMKACFHHEGKRKQYNNCNLSYSSYFFWSIYLPIWTSQLRVYILHVGL